MRVEPRLLLLRVRFLLFQQAVVVASLVSAPFVRAYSLVQLVVLLSPYQVASTGSGAAQVIGRARATVVLALLELSGLESGHYSRQLTRVCAGLADEGATGLPSSSLVHAQIGYPQQNRVGYLRLSQQNCLEKRMG